MENKKELVSLNSKLYSSLSLEELEERMELGCWYNACGCDGMCNCDGQSGGTTCGGANVPVTCSTQCGANVPVCGYNTGG
jgi:hypothetical protein